MRRGCIALTLDGMRPLIWRKLFSQSFTLYLYFWYFDLNTGSSIICVCVARGDDPLCLFIYFSLVLCMF